MGIVLIILLVLFLWGIMYLRSHPEVLMRWLASRLMPPEMRRQMREARKQSKAESGHKGAKSYWTRPRRAPQREESIIPKEYAQDVEYTETVTYKSDVEITDQRATEEKESSRRVKVKVESQVSDAEWVEIK